jgi:hypothetical protein
MVHTNAIPYLCVTCIVIGPKCECVEITVVAGQIDKCIDVASSPMTLAPPLLRSVHGSILFVEL